VNTDILPPRYRGAQPIGRGGMGDIYRATDSTLGRAVAVKVLAERYAEDDAVRSRFTREALAAARLSGEPNTVTIFDVGEHQGRPFIVMEYLGGGSLDDVLRKEGAQAPERAFHWLEQSGRALDAAHRAGVVHRDVKPGNLMLDRNGDVHVADFGIASAAGMDSLTMTGTVLGTAGYLSPEQAQGDRATPASDRYALAVVAFELLTGKRPFAAESPTAEASAHVHADVPSVCDQRWELPCELDPVFAKALAKDPDERYDSCAEFVAALRGALAEAAGSTRELPLVGRAAPTAAPRRLDRRDEAVRTAPPPYAPYPPHRAGRRRSAWPALVALLALGAIGGALAAYFLTRDDGSSTAKPQAAAPQPSVVTQTVQRTIAGQNVTTTVISTALPPPSTAARATTPAAPPPSGASGHALNDQGYARMRSGDYGGALPALQQAVQKLRGVGPSDPYEAYANYNLGYTLLQLNRCADAIPYLQRAQQLEPQRSEPGRALARARVCAG
jgi:eukaryotic-like serine/threonine-protein kinase